MISKPVESNELRIDFTYELRNDFTSLAEGDELGNDVKTRRRRQVGK